MRRGGRQSGVEEERFWLEDDPGIICRKRRCTRVLTWVSRRALRAFQTPTSMRFTSLLHVNHIVLHLSNYPPRLGAADVSVCHQRSRCCRGKHGHPAMRTPHLSNSFNLANHRLGPASEMTWYGFDQRPDTAKCASRLAGHLGVVVRVVLEDVVAIVLGSAALLGRQQLRCEALDLAQILTKLSQLQFQPKKVPLPP